MARFAGETWADIIEVRFASSGKVASVNKRSGDLVKKWQSLASLDRKLLQTELDRQLADYDKTRAEFEIFNKKSTDSSEIGRFSKIIEQSQLNASVKEVELSKIKLDQSDLLSPVDGLVISDGGCRVGLYITPASATFQVMDSASLVFRFKITEKELDKFAKPSEVKVVLPAQKKKITGTTRLPIPDNRGGFTVDVVLKESEGLLPGIKGTVEIS